MGSIMSSDCEYELEPQFYEIVGRIASDWSLLELFVNDCIWALASCQFKEGACITAQIFSMDGRMKALISLLNCKGFDEEFIKRVSRFQNGLLRKATDIRNRAIHDTWGHYNEIPAQLTITAKKTLVFAVEEISIDELLQSLAIIEDCICRFIEIRLDIEKALQGLNRNSQFILKPHFKPYAQEAIKRRKVANINIKPM